jgi:hypothetical protein
VDSPHSETPQMTKSHSAPASMSLAGSGRERAEGGWGDAAFGGRFESAFLQRGVRNEPCGCQATPVTLYGQSDRGWPTYQGAVFFTAMPLPTR